MWWVHGRKHTATGRGEVVWNPYYVQVLKPSINSSALLICFYELVWRRHISGRMRISLYENFPFFLQLINSMNHNTRSIRIFFVIHEFSVNVCLFVLQRHQYPLLLEAEVNSRAQIWKTSDDKERERRQAFYQEVLTQQQSVSQFYTSMRLVCTCMYRQQGSHLNHIPP